MNDSVSQHIQRLLDEGPIGMAQVAKIVGTFRLGKPCHPSTPTRWCLYGVRLPDGTVLRLEHYRTAGRLMTSTPAVVRFLVAQQTDPPPPPPRSAAERNRAAEAAGSELEKLGA